MAAAERRAREAEKDLDSLRALTRRAPETALREENARLRAQLEASKAETEKEARRVAEARLQAEHYRAQMHRLAAALKRERERGAIVARQELEQLRLEFLAREERCSMYSFFPQSFFFRIIDSIRLADMCLMATETSWAGYETN